jgi:hypothetical protein
MTNDKNEANGDLATAESANPRVWYFAYGASMNLKSFEALHISPTRSVAATIDLYLNFEMLLVPYMEPCFPSLGSKPIMHGQPRCHGVAFEVTEREFRYIVLKQSGNGYPGLGYEVSDMQCCSYAGEMLECKVLQIAKPRLVSLQPFPSRRYLDLVEAAAQAHHLDPTYQAWLSSIPGYDGPSTLRERIGKILFLLVFLPPLTIPIMLSHFWRPEQSPRFISAFLDRLRHPIWWCYERVFRPVFGSGAGEKPNNSSD